MNSGTPRPRAISTQGMSSLPASAILPRPPGTAATLPPDRSFMTPIRTPANFSTFSRHSMLAMIGASCSAMLKLTEQSDGMPLVMSVIALMWPPVGRRTSPRLGLGSRRSTHRGVARAFLRDSGSSMSMFATPFPLRSDCRWG